MHVHVRVRVVWARVTATSLCRCDALCRVVCGQFLAIESVCTCASLGAHWARKPNFCPCTHAVYMNGHNHVLEHLTTPAAEVAAGTPYYNVVVSGAVWFGAVWWWGRGGGVLRGKGRRHPFGVDGAPIDGAQCVPACLPACRRRQFSLPRGEMVLKELDALPQGDRRLRVRRNDAVTDACPLLHRRLRQLQARVSCQLDRQGQAGATASRSALRSVGRADGREGGRAGRRGNRACS